MPPEQSSPEVECAAQIYIGLSHLALYVFDKICGGISFRSRIPVETLRYAVLNTVHSLTLSAQVALKSHANNSREAAQVQDGGEASLLADGTESELKMRSSEQKELEALIEEIGAVFEGETGVEFDVRFDESRPEDSAFAADPGRMAVFPAVTNAVVQDRTTSASSVSRRRDHIHEPEISEAVGNSAVATLAVPEQNQKELIHAHRTGVPGGSAPLYVSRFGVCVERAMGPLAHQQRSQCQVQRMKGSFSLRRRLHGRRASESWCHQVTSVFQA
jgi:hypothetical protein